MNEIIYNIDGVKARIYNRTDAKNIYLQVYINGERTKKTLGTADRKIALFNAFQIITNQTYKDNHTLKFKDVATQFLKTMPNKKTKKTYEDTLNSVFYPVFKHKKINEITEQVIYALQMEKVQTVLPQTVNKYMVVLKQILKYAYKMGYINKLPEVEKLKEVKNARGFFTEKQTDEIFMVAKKRIDESKHPITKYSRTLLFLFINFLYETGLREDEVKSIKFNTVEKDIAGLTRSKTNVRDIFLTDNAQNIIEGLKRLYQANGVKFNDNSYLFLNRRGNPIGSLKKGFNSLLLETSMRDKVGKNIFTQYSFRHCYITEKTNAGVSATAIKLQCGTSTRMLEKHYIHTNIHQVKDQLK